MNALVSIDRILSPETIATPADILTPAIVFAPGGVEAIISKLEAEVRATDRDMTTDAGREAIKSLAYKVARSKTALDEMGKELVADIKKQSGAIDAERRVIRERLDALRDEVRAPLTAWEEAETARVDGHEKALVWLVECDRFATTPTAAMIRAQALDVSALSHRDWQEFKERGDLAVIEAHAKLSLLLLTAEQFERDAAELAELRRLKAENEAREVAAKFEAVKAENARIAAEQEAARVAAFAEQARVRAEQQAVREAEMAAQAVRDAEAAAAKAVEDERKRVAAAKAAEDAATAKREANKRHRASVHSKITLALSEVLTGNADEAAALIEAIADGKIPHVSITY